MIYQRGKKKTYWFRFRFGGRIHHNSTRTTSKTLARDIERARREELVKRINGIEDRPSLPPSVKVAATAWQEARSHELRPNTRRMAAVALKRVLPVFGSKLLCDVDAKALREYQQHRLADGAQGRTINIEVGVLRQILKEYDERRDYWRAMEGRVKMLPENHDIGRALEPDEEYRLLQAAHGLDSACYTAVALALATAMRHEEVCTLQWQQIDFGARTLTVGKSKTEAGTGRLIPLNTAFDALAQWAKRFPDAQPEHYVFPFCEHRRVDPTRPTKGWRTAWRNALKRAGVHCRFHDLRVTAVTKLAEAGVPPETMRSIAGHVSQKMLEHYSRIRVDAKRAAVESLRPTFQPPVHQIVHQIEETQEAAAGKFLN